MNIRKSILLSVAAVVIAAPGLSLASSLYHDAGGDASFIMTPEHVKSTETRVAVLQEVDTARKNGYLQRIQAGGSVPVKATAPGKTREQVRQELLNMSAQEKQRMQDIFAGGN